MFVLAFMKANINILAAIGTFAAKCTQNVQRAYAERAAAYYIRSWGVLGFPSTHYYPLSQYPNTCNV